MVRRPRLASFSTLRTAWARTGSSPWSSRPPALRCPRDRARCATCTPPFSVVESPPKAAYRDSADVETESAKHLPAVVCDLVRSPRRHPHPLDPEIVDQALKSGTRLVFDDIGERARCRRKCHRQYGIAVLVDLHPVH